MTVQDCHVVGGGGEGGGVLVGGLSVEAICSCVQLSGQSIVVSRTKIYFCSLQNLLRCSCHWFIVCTPVVGGM